MVQNESQAREALFSGRAVQLVIKSFDGNTRNLFLIPSTSIENETRKGVLITLEGRGCFFFDGSEKLLAIELVKNGFMPLDAARTIAALKQIFPEFDEPPAPPAMGNQKNTLTIEDTRNEHHQQTQGKSRSKRPKRPTATKSAKPASAQRPASPPAKRKPSVRGSRAKRSGDGQACGSA